MKSFLFFFLAVGVAIATGDEHPEFRGPDRTPFSVKYDTETGIHFEEQGTLVRSENGDGQVLARNGRYSYTSPEGVPVAVAFTADQRGFRVISDNLPRPLNIRPQDG